MSKTYADFVAHINELLPKWWDALAEADQMHLRSCVVLGGIADAHACDLLEAAPIKAMTVELDGDAEHPLHLIDPITQEFINGRSTT